MTINTRGQSTANGASGCLIVVLENISPYRNGSWVGDLVWILLAMVIAAMATTAVVSLVHSFSRENRRINTLIANADCIIAADREAEAEAEAEADEGGFRSRRLRKPQRPNG